VRRYAKCGTPQKPIKRHASTLEFWASLKRVIDAFPVISTRFGYYRAESAGLVPKTDAGYNKVQRALVDMRREGLIPYSKVRDTTRVRRRVWSVETFEQAAESWTEKDSLSPLVEPICQEFGMHYAPMRGFDSESFCSETAEELKKVQKPIRIYYLGDYDPSGWWAAKTIEEDLYTFGVDAEVYHLAVLPEQIQQWRLSPRRASTSDSRYRAFVRELGSDLAVEVEAIRPDIIDTLVREAIVDNISEMAWHKAMISEKAQRETTESVMRVWSRMEPGEILSAGGRR
jgi:hypothetical protein